MYFHDEETEHTIIGEAAQKLLLQGEQVSVESLISQLNIMAECEGDDVRILHLYEAKKWLLKFKTVSSRQQGSRSWLSEPAAGTGTSASDINLPQPQKTHLYNR